MLVFGREIDKDLAIEKWCAVVNSLTDKNTEIISVFADHLLYLFNTNKEFREEGRSLYVSHYIPFSLQIIKRVLNIENVEISFELDTKNIKSYTFNSKRYPADEMFFMSEESVYYEMIIKVFESIKTLLEAKIAEKGKAVFKPYSLIDAIIVNDTFFEYNIISRFDIS